jgi:hypothetical protein
MYNIIYPNNAKYDAYGHSISCTGGTGLTTCASAKTAWLTTARQNQTPAPTLNYAHAHKTVECYLGNNSTQTKYTAEAFNNDTAACALVKLNYGYY